MFLPSLTHPVAEGTDNGTYCVYVGLEGLQGSVRFLADCQDGIPRRIAVLADGIGLAGWLVQNLYTASLEQNPHKKTPGSASQKLALPGGADFKF